MKSYLTLLIGLSISSLAAQLPATDLYMVSLLNNGEKISIKDPIYLSGFNPGGYNNQPYFLNPRTLLITSDHYDKQFTDVIKLDLMREKYYRVTATDSISEYSPTPNAVDGYFSTVRVEKDGTTQSLWLYPDNHQSYGMRVLTDEGNVGYHCWVSDNEVMLFLVGTPMTLAIGNLEENSTNTIVEGIGRCFRKTADEKLLFVHKMTEETWYIKTYNPADGTIDTVTRTRPGSEDFEVLGDGTLIMGEASKLFSIKPKGEEYWTEFADLSEFDIKKITRLALSRNKLVIVDNP